MTFKAHKFQPCNIVFELEIGDLKRIYEMPQHPVDCTISFKSDGNIGQVEINLFDDKAYEVEQAIYKQGDSQTGVWLPVGKFRWGYTAQEEHLSEWYTFQLLDYTVNIGKNYVTLSLNGQITPVRGVLLKSKLEGTLTEICVQYAAEYEYNLVINPPFDSDHMQEVDRNGSQTIKLLPEYSREDDQSDFAFLKLLVEEHGVDAQGKYGYTCEHTEIGGVKYLVIKHQDVYPKHDIYEVQHKDSVVVEWTPEISFAGTAALGGEVHVATSTQTITGDDQTFAASPSLTDVPKIGAEQYDTHITRPEDQIQHTKLFGDPQDHTTALRHSGKKRAMATSDPKSDFNRMQSEWTRQHLNNKWNATMIIEGDPYIRPRVIITVNYRYPSTTDPEGSKAEGQLHYSSGDWSVEEVIHNISAGTYTTTLVLFRHFGHYNPTTGPASDNTTGA